MSAPLHPSKPHSTPQHHAPATRIATQCPTPHTRHSTRPSRTTNYLVEWETITCPYHIAQAHITRGTPITNITITPQFATNRPIIPEELDPPCFQCQLGEGDSRDPNLLQCERCLRWVHAHCLPQPTPIDQLILIEGWTCHECDPPTPTNPCPHQICKVQFAPTPHTRAVILKTPGGKQALHNFQTPTPPDTHTTHNPQTTTTELTHHKHPETTHNNSTPTPPTHRNLKRTTEQDKNETAAPTPPSKHPRPNNHTTSPKRPPVTTETFRAGRRRKPPHRTQISLTNTNTTRKTHTSTQPKNH